MAKYTFKLLYGEDPIITSFIPVNPIYRGKFYERMNVAGILIPDIGDISRENMREQDLMVVLSPVSIKLEYNRSVITINVKPGFVFDSGSVPVGLVHGDLNKFGQAIELPSLVHDILFATKVLPFSDANNIFVGLLKSTGLLSNATVLLYKIGVSSIVGRRIYNNGVPEKYWGRDYVEIKVERC